MRIIDINEEELRILLSQEITEQELRMIIADFGSTSECSCKQLSEEDKRLAELNRDYTYLRNRILKSFAVINTIDRKDNTLELDKQKRDIALDDIGHYAYCAMGIRIAALTFGKFVPCQEMKEAIDALAEEIKGDVTRYIKKRNDLLQTR